MHTWDFVHVYEIHSAWKMLLNELWLKTKKQSIGPVVSERDKQMFHNNHSPILKKYITTEILTLKQKYLCGLSKLVQSFEDALP